MTMTAKEIVSLAGMSDIPAVYANRAATWSDLSGSHLLEIHRKKAGDTGQGEAVPLLGDGHGQAADLPVVGVGDPLVLPRRGGIGVDGGEHIVPGGALGVDIRPCTGQGGVGGGGILAEELKAIAHGPHRSQLASLLGEDEGGEGFGGDLQGGAVFVSGVGDGGGGHGRGLLGWGWVQYSILQGDCQGLGRKSPL